MLCHKPLRLIPVSEPTGLSCEKHHNSRRRREALRLHRGPVTENLRAQVLTQCHRADSPVMRSNSGRRLHVNSVYPLKTVGAGSLSCVRVERACVCACVFMCLRARVLCAPVSLCLLRVRACYARACGGRLARSR